MRLESQKCSSNHTHITSYVQGSYVHKADFISVGYSRPTVYHDTYKPFQFNYDNLDYLNCSLTINYIVYHKVSCADPENYSGGGGPMELVSYRMRYCVTLEQL